MKSFFKIKIFFLLTVFLAKVPFVQATTYTVNVSTDTGAGAGLLGDLRYCINTANGNATAGPHYINFAIPGVGPYSIILSGGSYTITRDMVIDATTQSGYNIGSPTPMVELKSSSSQAFVINSGNVAIGSTIKGFIINNCNAQGIIIQSPNNIIVGNYIGTNTAGMVPIPNQAAGILINGCCGFNTNGNIIGGITTALRNVISGNNSHGIESNTSSNNVIIGNYIGLNSSGNAALGNSYFGINIYGVGTGYKIGGLASDSVNVISGNGQIGVSYNGITSSRIVGNLIGTDITGNIRFGNSQHGIYITSSSNILVYGNTISGNGQIGINAVVNGSGILIKKNYVGTSSNGLSSIGNSIHGIQIQSTPGGVVIGGNRLTEGNIISNSGIHGINIDPGSAGSIIKGNIVGSDINGTAHMGNGVIGIVAKSNNQIIGGTTNNEGNIIVDSKDPQVGCGILLANANNAIVSGNYIGVGLDFSSIPNHAEGINISVENAGQTAANNTVQFNIIAYNLGHGINVGDALPMQELGSGGYVSNNDEYGNLIRWNSIYCNVYKGISLNFLGIPADRGNTGRSSPVLIASTSTVVNGTTLPNDSVHIYVMDLCSNCNSNPQGKTFVGATKANAAGNWTYTSGSSITGNITVTGTDVTNNTSEFSICLSLPVTLISFTAQMDKNQQTLLSWTTSGEKNNDRFIIEKSIDGIYFTDIGEVKGAGNSTVLSLYTYIDISKEAETIYYRLRQVDLNGGYEFSNIISIKYQDTLATQLYPNPATDEVFINIMGEHGQLYKYTITDVLGRVVQEETISINKVTGINVSNLSGQYIICLFSIAGDYFYCDKISVIK